MGPVFRRIGVIRRVLTPVSIGLLVGLGITLPAVRALSAVLYGVIAFDPVAFTGAVLVLLVVAVLAAVIPARRAGSADPLIVLRTE